MTCERCDRCEPSISCRPGSRTLKNEEVGTSLSGSGPLVRTTNNVRIDVKPELPRTPGDWFLAADRWASLRLRDLVRNWSNRQSGGLILEAEVEQLLFWLVRNVLETGRPYCDYILMN